jgi:hypothetical protein
MANLTTDLLTTCLDDVLAGHATPDACAREHPAEAEELRALLVLAQAIVPPPVPALDASARRLGRANLLREINAPKVPVTRRLVQRFLGAIDGIASPGRALQAVGMPLVSLLIVVCLLAFGGGVALAAQDTLPGDSFYWVKTGLEDVSLTLAPGPASRAQVYLELASRRLDEIERADLLRRPTAAALAAHAFGQDLALADDERRQAIAAGAAADQVNARFAATLRALRARADIVRARVGSTDPALGSVVQALGQSFAAVGVASPAASPAARPVTPTAAPAPASAAPAPAPGANLAQSPLLTLTPTPFGSVGAVASAGATTTAPTSAPPVGGTEPSPLVVAPAPTTFPSPRDTPTSGLARPTATSLLPTRPAAPTAGPVSTAPSLPIAVPTTVPVATARPTTNPTTPPLPTAIPTSIPTAVPTSIPVPTHLPRPTALPTVVHPPTPPVPTAIPIPPTPRPPVPISTPDPPTPVHGDGRGGGGGDGDGQGHHHRGAPPGLPIGD